MGDVLILKGRPAETPFYIESVGVRIYSLEELAYFLYENIYIVDKRMLGERLIEWLDTEMHEKQLADRLRMGAASGANIQNMVMTILRGIEFYSTEELEQLSSKLKILNTYQEQERIKLRADEYFNTGNYQAAIYEYEKILDIRQSVRLGVEFYAHVWNNLGVCYARLFLFGKAASAFRTSYRYDRDETVLKEYVMAMRMGLDDNDFEEAMELQHIGGEDLLQMTEEFDRLKENAYEHVGVGADPASRLLELEHEYVRNTRN